MKEWVEQNLMNSQGNLIPSRMHIGWFKRRNLEKKYEELLDINANLKTACKMLFGYRPFCATCNKPTIYPDQYCSFDCGVKNESTKEKRKNTNIEKYGVENVFKSKKIKDKIKDTMAERYGVEYSLRSKDLKDKAKQTLLKNFGVDHPSKSEIIKDKIKATNLERYGNECAIATDEIREKIKTTNLEHHGVEYTFQSQKIYNKAKETMLSRYGSEHALQVDKFKQKLVETNLKRYGIEYPMTAYDSEKPKITSLKKYGVDHPMKIKEIRAKASETYHERYGKQNSINRKILRNKVEETNRLRFGVSFFQQNHYSEELKGAIDNELKDVTGLNDPVFDCVKSHATRYNLLHAYRPDIKFEGKGSFPEREMKKFIESFGLDVITNTRTILNSGKEIDVYIPGLKLGFEYNGNYWHSDAKIDREYHQNKSLDAKESGIRLVHIYEFNGEEMNNRIIEEHIKNIFSKQLVSYQIENKEFVESPLDHGFNDELEKQGYKFVGIKTPSAKTILDNKIVEEDTSTDKSALIVYDAGYEIFERIV